MQRYLDMLTAAMIQRRAATQPGVAPVVAACVLLTLAYILVAIGAGEPTDPDFHFDSERGAVNALSALYLAAAGTLSLSTMLALLHAGDRDARIWLTLALGFAVLALDELLEFHERGGALLGRQLGAGAFRNWNDIIVILYGLVALPVMAWLLPGLLRWRAVGELFLVAFLFYAAHTLVDSTQEPPTIVSNIVEESFKLMCSAFLALGAFAGVVGTLWRRPVSAPVPEQHGDTSYAYVPRPEGQGAGGS